MIQDNPNIDDYKERLTNFSHEFDVGLFLHIVRKSLLWLVLFLVLGMGGAFIYLRYTPLTYQVRAILQIGEEDSANRILNVSQFAEDNTLEAKIELMRSRLLVQNALENMPLEVGYFAKGQILTNEHYVLSPYQIEVESIKDSTIFNRPIFINFNEGNSFTIQQGGKTFDNLSVGSLIELPTFTFTLTITDINSLNELRNQDQLYVVLNSREVLAKKFASKLDVHVLNSTAKTVEVSYKANNTYLARDFVAAVAHEFIRFDLEKRKRSDDNILSFIDAQIDTVFERLKDSEVLLNEYKQVNKITDLNSISGVYLERLNDLENRVIELEIEEKLLGQLEKLTSKNSSEIAVNNLLPILAGSNFESSLKTSLGDLHMLLLKREEMLFTVTDDNNIVKGIDFQIEIQRSLIIETIKALRAKLSARIIELKSKLKGVETVYYGLPTKELEFARLERLFAINEKYYTMLLEKRIEYQISKEGFVSQNQILEEPRLPDAPIAPQKKMVLFSFLLGGLLLGFIFISVRYLLHNEVTSLNEIVRLSNASISTLGIIPKYKHDIPISMLLINKSPKSIIAEAFRNIRTNLQFIDNSPGPKIAAITSTISGEGKTFIAINLAGIIAFSGKRVVVLDLDMRKPKIHKGMKLKNQVGMSTLLIGKTTVTECIQKSKLENLDFITAGPIPPNPSELIIGSKMDEVLEELKKSYDFIIIDTPPVGLVTDGVSMIQKADYPLYVFRADYSKKQFIHNVDRLNNESKISKLSVILNGVDLDRNRYSYNYGYGYSYGYGYGGTGGGYYDDVKVKRGFFKRRK
jgi:tyrosine-protein kinase Etk/Wzc